MPADKPLMHLAWEDIYRQNPGLTKNQVRDIFAGIQPGKFAELAYDVMQEMIKYQISEYFAENWEDLPDIREKPELYANQYIDAIRCAACGSMQYEPTDMPDGICRADDCGACGSTETYYADQRMTTEAEQKQSRELA